MTDSSDSKYDYLLTAAHGEALGDLTKIVEVLFSDVERAGTNLHEGGPEQQRRYVRNVIAAVEGVTAAMRRIALADAEAGTTDFSQGERAILCGLRYELDGKGGVRATPNYQRLAPSVRFSFTALAKTYRVEFSLAVEANGWQCLRRAVEVRNRLVHPKKPQDLEVTVEELKDAFVGVEWPEPGSSGLVGVSDLFGREEGDAG